jgi:signal peptidase I
MTSTAFTRAALAAIGVALAVVAWVLFAPAALGGSASYAVVYGSSMEPKLEAGDLAVIRPADAYEVGDVVAYRSHELGRVVLHRIIGRDGGRYVFQGDNNDFVDPDRPAAGALVGSLWLQIPFAGRVFLWLRSPLNAAVLVLVLFLAAAGTGTAVRRSHRAAGSPYLVPGLVVAALTAGAVAATAFAMPVERTVVDPAAYTQRGVFAYTAAVPVGDVYGSASASTGDPVFVRLVRDVQVAFGYRLDSRLPTSVRGTARLDAVLSDGGGWTRTVALGRRVAFSGPRVTLAGTLDLLALRRMIDALESRTALHADSYLVRIVPHVSVQGSVGGRRLADTFDPPLDLRLDSARLAPALPGPGEEAVSPFVKERSGAGVRRVEAELGLGRFHTPVAAARELALVLVALALVALAAVGTLRRRTAAAGEPARIAARHGDLLLSVLGDAARPDAERVQVGSFADLVAVAEAADRMILHTAGGGLHTYAVEQGGLAYVYESREPAPKAGRRARPVLLLRRLGGVR